MSETSKNTNKDSSSELKKLNKLMHKSDPIVRNVEKENGTEEHSPMDPPDAYDETMAVKMDPKKTHKLLQQYMDEHKVAISVVKTFEKALINFKEAEFKLNADINNAFSEFFHFFDHKIMDHNQREEKELFPMLHSKLIESGEHGEGMDPTTAVDMMEDDHVKFIQLASLAFNLLGVAARLPDYSSKMFVYNVAFDNGIELIEMLRLHIYREDNIVFPLAQELISQEEFETLHLRTIKANMR